jgi:uncharacterized membrane protein
MSTPLISPDWTFALWGIILGVAAFGFWLDTTTLGKRVSGVSMLLVVALILSNVGVIPHASPVYESIWRFLVPVAIPLLLLNANLRQVFRVAGPMLKIFAVAVFGTLAGAVTGFWLFPIDPVGADLAGILSATYIGGSMNFVAVSEVLEIQDRSLLAAALAADNVAGTIFIIFIVAVPSITRFRSWIPSPIADAAEQTRIQQGSAEGDGSMLNLIHISASLAISLLVCAVGYGLAKVLDVANYGILFVTVITLVIANIFHDRIEKLTGHVEVGMLFMFAFFVTIGAGTELAVLFETGLNIFLLAMTIITVHTAFLLLGAKLLKIDLAEAAIASMACVGGPALPAAIAPARGWHALTTPGIMCGVLGYAIANFLGVGLAQLLG